MYIPDNSARLLLRAKVALTVLADRKATQTAKNFPSSMREKEKSRQEIACLEGLVLEGFLPLVVP